MTIQTSQLMHFLAKRKQSCWDYFLANQTVGEAYLPKVTLQGECDGGKELTPKQ